MLCALVTACILALLPLGVTSVATADGKPAGKAAQGKKKAKKKKRKAKQRKAASKGSGPAGSKGDRGEKGEKGDKGDRGPAGPSAGTQSSIVARARNAAPTSTGDGGDVKVPLTGNTWTAAPDEADDFAGSVTMRVPQACDSPEEDDPFTVLPPPVGYEPFPGFAEVGVELGERFIGFAFVDWNEDAAGKTVTMPIQFRGRALNGATPKDQTLTALAYDACGGDGQSFEVTDLRVNVYALR